MSEFYMQVQLILQTCCHSECGLSFAVPKTWDDARRKDHNRFYCPNGHGQSYSGETEAERLRREKQKLELDAQARINDAKHLQLVAERARDKAIKEKRQVERRIAHGVCPCCNKTFADLSHHMITDHKDFRLPGGKAQKRLTA